MENPAVRTSMAATLPSASKVVVAGPIHEDEYWLAPGSRASVVTALNYTRSDESTLWKLLVIDLPEQS